MSFTEKELYKQWHLPIRETAEIEYKLTKKTSLPFSALKDTQIASLTRALTGHWWRVQDASGAANYTACAVPCDVVYIRTDHVYVGVCFFKGPRKKHPLYFVHINDWVKEKTTSARKSLTEECAQRIATYCVEV